MWNIGYDWVLSADLLEGVFVVCYADTLVLAQGRAHQAAAELATGGVAIVVDRIRHPPQSRR